MAAKRFDIVQGDNKSAVTINDTSDIATGLRVTANTTAAKSDIVKNLDIIKARILETDWPPAA